MHTNCWIILSVLSSTLATTFTFPSTHRLLHGELGLQVPLQDQSTSTLTLKARPTTVYKPRSDSALQHARLRSLQFGQSEPLEWDAVEILGPDIEDRHTLAQLARMSGNAYAIPGQKDWYEVDPAWNTVCTHPSASKHVM